MTQEAPLMGLRMKILLGLLITVAILQAAFINYLLATLGVLRERNELLVERVEMTKKTVAAVKELADTRLRLCSAYRSTLWTMFNRLGLDRPKSAAADLLEAFDVRRGMPGVRGVHELSCGHPCNMGGPQSE